MTSRTVALISGALISVLSIAAMPQSPKDWVDIKDPNELRALHSNKTFRGTGGDGVSWVAHYRSDGRALLIRPEERIPRTWEVKGNDQVCYQDTRFPGCRLFQRNKENPNKFRTAWGGFHWAEFKVEDGIPQF